MDVSMFNMQRVRLTNAKNLIQSNGKTVSNTIKNSDELILSKNRLLVPVDENAKPQRVVPIKYKEVHDSFGEVFQSHEISNQQYIEILHTLDELTNKKNGSYYGFDSRALAIAQSHFELEKFTEEKIPEQYHEKMYDAINSHMSKQFEGNVRLLKSFYNSLISRSPGMPEPTRTNWMENGMENVTQIGNRTHRVYEAHSLYTSLFNELKGVDSEYLNIGYENILNTYYLEEKRTTKVWLSTSEAGVNRMQQQMRQRWNEFIQIKDGFTFKKEHE